MQKLADDLYSFMISLKSEIAVEVDVEDRTVQYRLEELNLIKQERYDNDPREYFRLTRLGATALLGGDQQSFVKFYQQLYLKKLDSLLEIDSDLKKEEKKKLN